MQFVCCFCNKELFGVQLTDPGMCVWTCIVSVLASFLISKVTYL
jgi:hypothetical protein